MRIPGIETLYNRQKRVYTDEEITLILLDISGDISHMKNFNYVCPYCKHEWTQKNHTFGISIIITQEAIEEKRKEMSTGSAPSATGFVGAFYSNESYFKKRCPRCTGKFGYYPYDERYDVPTGIIARLVNLIRSKLLK